MSDAHPLIGTSPAMEQVHVLIDRFAPDSGTVLIIGETGTGKEAVARRIHARSRCRRGPFVPCNLGGITPTLISSELFGHVRGAFTGADHDHAGLFEQAHGGTLFLDEIGDMPREVQPFLLRVLQDRTVRRVGATAEKSVDVRLVAATNKNLEAEVRDGRFRDDLFYRVAELRIYLPPLRHRGADIVLLADHFLDQYRADHGIARCVCGDGVKEVLRAYPWPGNIRELQSAMRNALLAARDDPRPDPTTITLEIRHLEERLLHPAPALPAYQFAALVDVAFQALRDNKSPLEGLRHEEHTMGPLAQILIAQVLAPAFRRFCTEDSNGQKMLAKYRVGVKPNDFHRLFYGSDFDPRSRAFFRRAINDMIVNELADLTDGES